MTASVLLDMPTRRRAFPQIFNRLVVILAVQAHLYALVVIAGSGPATARCPPAWRCGRSRWPCRWPASSSPAGPDGALPAVPFLAASVLLVAVDLGLTAVVRLPDRGGGAMWNWGVIGVTILGFAAFRPARDVLLVAGGHGLIAIGVTATAPGQAAAVAFAVLVAANAAVTPALAAARYLNLYIQAVRLREQAAADRRRIQTRHAAEQAIEEDAAWRLRSLQAEAVPLLAGVANGTLAVDDPQVAMLARRLGADLRRELMAARSSQWLLPVSWGRGGPRAERRTARSPSPPRPPGRQRPRRAGRAAQRAARLRRLAAPLRRPGPEATASRPAVVTVVATGPDAATAAQDAAVVAAARQLGATARPGGERRAGGGDEPDSRSARPVRRASRRVISGNPAGCPGRRARLQPCPPGGTSQRPCHVSRASAWPSWTTSRWCCPPCRPGWGRPRRASAWSSRRRAGRNSSAIRPSRSTSCSWTSTWGMTSRPR